MTTWRRQRFVAGTMAWFLGSALVLALLDVLEYEIFFVLSFIGFLVVVELTAPLNLTPTWRGRLKWLIGLGLLALAFILVRRVFEILSRGGM